MSEEWKWVEKFVLALEDPTLRRRTYIYGDEAYQLIACIKALREALTEINHQSIAHDDDSLSSKWLTHLTEETLAHCKEGKFDG